MYFNCLSLAALAAATASALASAQASSPVPADAKFGLVAIHSGSAVHNQGFNAALSSIFAGLPAQNASCARPGEKYATFYLNEGALFLYDASATPQQIYVDRSGMGM